MSSPAYFSCFISCHTSFSQLPCSAPATMSYIQILELKERVHAPRPLHVLFFLSGVLPPPSTPYLANTQLFSSPKPEGSSFGKLALIHATHPSRCTAPILAPLMSLHCGSFPPPVVASLLVCLPRLDLLIGSGPPSPGHGHQYNNISRSNAFCLSLRFSPCKVKL